MRNISRSIVGAALLAVTAASFGQVVNLANNGSLATIYPGAAGNPNTGAFGLTDWHVVPGGPNWVDQQLYLVRINGGAVFNSLNGLVAGGQAALNIIQPTADLAETDYAVAGGFDFNLRYLLTGGQPNSSDLAEVMTVVNRSNANMTLSLFEYDHFTPGGVFGGVGTLLNSSTIQQVNAAGTVTVGATPIPSRWMIDTVGNVQGAIGAGNLTNTASPFAAADLAFAFQWNVVIGANQTWQMSKDKQLTPTPEPASMLALGGMALLAIGRRRRSK